MNPWWWMRFAHLAAILWWGFVGLIGLFAIAVIALNLRAQKKEPPA